MAPGLVCGAYVDASGTRNVVLRRKDRSPLPANSINHPDDVGHWVSEQAPGATQFRSCKTADETLAVDCGGTD